MDHPSEETLKRFASGEAMPEEKRAVVAHLLKGCAVCSEKLKSFLGPEPDPRQAYQAVLDRFDRRFLDALEASMNPREALAEPPRRSPFLS